METSVKNRGDDGGKKKESDKNKCTKLRKRDKEEREKEDIHCKEIPELMVHI